MHEGGGRWVDSNKVVELKKKKKRVRGFPSDSVIKNSPAVQEMWVRFLGQEDPLEKERATHSSILAWEIPWIGEPVGLQPMGLQKSRT